MANINIAQKLDSIITRSNEIITNNEANKVAFRNNIVSLKDDKYNELYVLEVSEPVEPPPPEPLPPVYIIRPELNPEQVSSLTSELNTLTQQLADIDRLIAFWVDKTEQTDTTFLPSNITFIEYQVLIFNHKQVINITNDKKAFLNTVVSNNLINFDLPEKNSLYGNYEKTNEYLIQFSDCFKDKNFVDNYIKYNNAVITLLENNTDFDLPSTLNTWFITIEDRINKLIITFDNISIYFNELKAVIVDFKISDKRIKTEDWEGMYQTRNTDSKSRIDNLVNIYTTDVKLYEKEKKDIMQNLKLDNTVEY